MELLTLENKTNSVQLAQKDQRSQQSANFSTSPEHMPSEKSVRRRETRRTRAEKRRLFAEAAADKRANRPAPTGGSSVTPPTSERRFNGLGFG